jgi:hypothetical protein
MKQILRILKGVSRDWFELDTDSCLLGTTPARYSVRCFSTAMPVCIGRKKGLDVGVNGPDEISYEPSSETLERDGGPSIVKVTERKAQDVQPQM